MPRILMPRVLVISSSVARGHVGLSAIVPVLQGLGLETVALPTIVLSNHPGHATFAGASMPVAQLAAMRDALAANGWLADIDAILTGYFPTAAHVAFAHETVAQVRAANPHVLVCCDPVLGDHPDGLYVPLEVAEAVRSQLLPLSTVITPNRFELEWLSGQSAASPEGAVAAARALGRPLTLVTSVPATAEYLANVVVAGDQAWLARSPVRSGVPHGTGDVIAAAFLAAILRGRSRDQALATAAGCVDVLVAASAGEDELQLATSRSRWTTATPAAVEALWAAY